MERMPVGFVGHGNPLNVAIPERYEPWVQWGARLPRPKAVLAVSAHWEGTPVLVGSTTDHHEIMYDFGGFPEWMYRIAYPAPGAPDVADRVVDLLGAGHEVVRTDRLIDHGVWVPMRHLFPDADVPVLQISMPMTMSSDDLFEMGKELAALRDEGVFILGTGNVVHNLRGVDWEHDAPTDYAVTFDEWVARSLRARDDRAIVGWDDEAPEPLRSHPSAEHYRPLIVATGAAVGSEVRFPVEGFEHATISRRSIQFD